MKIVFTSAPIYKPARKKPTGAKEPASIHMLLGRRKKLADVEKNALKAMIIQLRQENKQLIKKLRQYEILLADVIKHDLDS